MMNDKRKTVQSETTVMNTKEDLRHHRIDTLDEERLMQTVKPVMKHVEVGDEVCDEACDDHERNECVEGSTHRFYSF